MRLFLATNFTELFLQSYALLRDKLIDIFPDIKWIKPQNVHMTLNFLGNIESSRINRIIDVLDTLKYHSFDFETNSTIGAFPNRRKPRVLWLGVSQQTAANLINLKKMVDSNLVKIDFNLEKRRYNPHLTLARIPQNFNWQDDYWPQIQSLNLEIVNANIFSFELMESTLTQKGAIYSVRHSFRLDPAL